MQVKSWPDRIARLLTCATVGFVVAAALSGQALAATIDVTTTADTISPDGQCSLREAVTAANTNAAFMGCPKGDAAPGVIDVIRLPPGRYELTLGGKDEDENAEGDLDVTESVEFQGTASFDGIYAYGEEHFGAMDGVGGLSKFLALTLHWEQNKWSSQVELGPSMVDGYLDGLFHGVAVIANGLGDPHVLGDGDRVFHIDPGNPDAEEVDVTFRHVAIVKGDIGCTGIGCETGAAGVDQDGEGDLTFEYAAVARNTISCQGVQCGNENLDPESQSTKDGAGGIKTILGGDLTLRHSALLANKAICLDEDCAVGRAALLVDGEAGTHEVQHVVMAGNVGWCEGFHCSIDEVFNWDDGNTALFDHVLMRHNLAFCKGDFCETDELLEPDGFSSITMRDVDVSWNRLDCRGYDCDTDEILDGSADTYTIERATFRHNKLVCYGESCDTDEVIDESFDEATDVEVSGTLMFCKGAECDVDDMYCVSGGTHTRVRLERNVLFCIGPECTSDETADMGGGTYDDLVIRYNVHGCYGMLCQADDTARVGNDIIRNAEITDNVSFCRGSGCFIKGTGDPDDEGGGGGGVNIFDDTTIEDSLIARNKTQGFGAGITVGQNNSGTVDPATLTLIRSTVERNRARGDGGGIAILEGSTLNLEDSKVKRNRAGGTGGGVFNEGTLNSIGSTIKKNSPNDCVGPGTGCP